MTGKSIFSLVQGLSAKYFSAVELTKEYLDTIDKRDAEVGAFISVTADHALKTAAEVDRKRLCGEPLGALAGIPFAVKDNICTTGIRTTCGSRMLHNFVPPYTATAVERLETAGAVIIGKTNLDEFAMGAATDTSAFGITKNPLDLCRTAGGSSGGSAAALAADMCAFSLGSDTGGSVRLPASFCGLVGIKPTYGTVSRYGLVAFAPSLEQICPLTKSIRDSALVLEAMLGRDAHDATSLDRGGKLIPECSDVSGMRIALAINALDRVSGGVRNAVLCASNTLQAAGARITECSLPDPDIVLAAYYIISSAEASSNLARFDGVRYGHSAKDACDVEELFTKSRTEAFGDEVKRRILLGTFCLSHGARDEYYKRALAAKQTVRAQLDEILSVCDAILLPVAPSTAYRFEDKKAETLERWREDEHCVWANVTGLPSISVPFGKDTDGMPFGVQLIGRSLGESTLYRIGLALEESEERHD